MQGVNKMKQIIITAILCTSLTMNVMTYLEKGQPEYKPVLNGEQLAANENFQKLVDRLNQLPVKGKR
jgi:hypothetical protein